MKKETKNQEIPQLPTEKPDLMTDVASASEVSKEAVLTESPETDEITATEEGRSTEATTEVHPQTTNEETDAVASAKQEQAPKPLHLPQKAVISLTLKPIHLVITALVLVAITAGSVFIGMNLNRWLTDPDLDPDAEKYPYPGTTDVAEGQIAIPGYSNIIFAANSRNVKMILPNPDGNPCYFVFSLVLKETGETIYRSGMIPPGMAVTDLTLFRPLTAGEYQVEVRIETFSLDEKLSMNGATINATLTVK